VILNTELAAFLFLQRASRCFDPTCCNQREREDRQEKHTLLTESQIMHDFQLYVCAFTPAFSTTVEVEHNCSATAGTTIVMCTMVLGDVDNSQPTIVQPKIACVR
jgi:hypothetical protein